MNVNCDVMNRDVKTDNVVIKNGEPKIIDFGYSTLSGNQKLQTKIILIIECIIAELFCMADDFCKFCEAIG